AVDEGLRAKLNAHWQAALAAARQLLAPDQCSTALIPEVQTAVDRWLTYLAGQGIAGGSPWARVEMIQEIGLGPYGYLNVVRCGGPDVPGVGIAAWLAEGSGRPVEFQKRLRFFDRVPCPIRTLVLFRRDGEEALAGVTGEKYAAALRDGRDVRVQRYEPRDMEAVLAFPRWLQAIRPDV